MESTLKESMRMLSAAPKLLEAAHAAWNCISELPPTQARVEVVQMLKDAIEYAEGGEPDSKGSKKDRDKGTWVTVPVTAPESMAELLTPYSINGLETERDRAAIRARMQERWERLLIGAGAVQAAMAAQGER